MVPIHLKGSKAIYWIFVTVLFFPTFILGLQSNGDIFETNFFQSIAYFLSVYVIVLTLLGHLFHKNYLSIFFGCHDRCDRSIPKLHHIIPICGRCTGIYFGFILSIGLSYLNLPFYFYIPLSIPLIIDGFIQLKGIESNVIRRLVTGLLFGPAMVSIFGLYNASIVFLVEQLLKMIK
jgi:uncharacterized membrane protein